ncbi:hypothetical protein [Helicobacter pametensis]|uniref:hypothetical protein n=1 Tax=Helicobacter pametensis TaxID=95149 RepID=UPI000481A73C|nr:hypothetical protein [Helicobacter pametensis]
MKLTSTMLDGLISFSCKDKLKSPQELFAIKRSILKLTNQYPEIKKLHFLLEAFPLDLSFLGLLLTLSNAYLYEVQITVTHYSNYRMLESLYLTQKFHVQYRKI